MFTSIWPLLWLNLELCSGPGETACFLSLSIPLSCLTTSSCLGNTTCLFWMFPINGIISGGLPFASFKKNFVYEYLAYVWVLCICLVPKEAESWVLGTGVTNGYELPCKCGSWTGILCKRNQCPRPLNHLSSPPRASLLCTFSIASISFHCWKKVK